MKRIVKTLFVLLGLFSLTSCMDLLPLPSRRTRKSSDEAISENFEDESSFNQKSNNTKTSYQGETNYYIQCSEPAPNGIANSATIVDFYLVDDYGNHAPLSDRCYVECSNPYLSISWSTFYDYLQVELYATDSGYFSFRVTVIAASGPSRTNNYYYNVGPGSDDVNSYCVEQPDNIEVPYSSDTFFDYRIVNRYTGQARRFNINHPYDVVSIPSSIQIEYFEFLDNETMLRILIKGIANTTASGDFLTLTLNDEGGNIFDSTVNYIVKPMAQIYIDETSNPIIEYGETVTYTFKLRSGLDGSRMYISKEGYELSSSDYLMEFDYIDSTKIRVNITNNKNVDEGWFSIRLVSEEGFVYEQWFIAVTSDRYLNYYWLQLNGESFVYGKDSYFAVILYNRHGDNKLIKNLTVTSTYGIIPNTTIQNINAYTYEYHFVPTRQGVEQVNLEVTCYDGTSYSASFETNIQ